MNEETVRLITGLVAIGGEITIGKQRVDLQSDALYWGSFTLVRATVECQGLTLVGEGKDIDEAVQSAWRAAEAQWAKMQRLITELVSP